MAKRFIFLSCFHQDADKSDNMYLQTVVHEKSLVNSVFLFLSFILFTHEFPHFTNSTFLVKLSSSLVGYDKLLGCAHNGALPG